MSGKGHNTSARDLQTANEWKRASSELRPGSTKEAASQKALYAKLKGVWEGT